MRLNLGQCGQLLCLVTSEFDGRIVHDAWFSSNLHQRENGYFVGFVELHGF